MCICRRFTPRSRGHRTPQGELFDNGDAEHRTKRAEVGRADCPHLMRT